MLLYNVYDNRFFYEDAEENRLEVSTKKGFFHVDMSLFFPVSKKDFNMFLAIIAEDRIGEPFHVEKLESFLSGAVDHLARLEKEERDPRTKASYTAKLKKWTALYNLLASRYNLEEKAKSEEAVKYKTIEAYPYIKLEEGKKPEPVKAWRFKKYGLDLYVYKNKSGAYHVIFPALGLSCCYGSSKAAAVAALTPELAEKIREVMKGNTTEARKRYVDYMAAAGLESVLENPFYNMPEAEKPLEDATPAEAAEDPTPETTTGETPTEAPEGGRDFLTVDNYNRYSAKNPETGEVIPLQYNGNEGYTFVTLVINGVYTIFSDCREKFHKDIYTLELICQPEESAPEATQQAASTPEPETRQKAATTEKETPPGKVYPETPEAARSAASALHGEVMPGSIPTPPELNAPEAMPAGSGESVAAGSVPDAITTGKAGAICSRRKKPSFRHAGIIPRRAAGAFPALKTAARSSEESAAPPGWYDPGTAQAPIDKDITSELCKALETKKPPCQYETIPTAQKASRQAHNARKWQALTAYHASRAAPGKHASGRTAATVNIMSRRPDAVLERLGSSGGRMAAIPDHPP